MYGYCLLSLSLSLLLLAFLVLPGATNKPQMNLHPPCCHCHVPCNNFLSPVPSYVSLLFKSSPQVIRAGRQLDFSDLESDPVVMFQHKSDPWFAFLLCFGLPGFIASAGWGDTFWHGFWVAGAVRYVLCLHCTWLVNSAAHFFGDHPYDNKSWPAENPVVSILSIGEGWHNW